MISPARARSCWPKTPYDGNVDLQDILVLNLTRSVQLCIDIGSHLISSTEEPAPQTMGEVFDTLEALDAITAQSQ